MQNMTLEALRDHLEVELNKSDDTYPENWHKNRIEGYRAALGNILYILPPKKKTA